MADDTFERWYRSEHPRVLAALAVSSADHALAVEAVDEAFARAWARWERVSTMGNPVGWVYRVARNELGRVRRRGARERTGVEGVGEPVWDPPMSDPTLWQQVRQLPERQREAIALRYVVGLTQPEIAKAMRVRPGTVAATLHTARAALRTTMEPETLR